MVFARNKYKTPSQVLMKKTQSDSLLIQQLSFILSSVKVFTGLLSTSSHYSHVKLSKSSWLFQEFTLGSNYELLIIFKVTSQLL